MSPSSPQISIVEVPLAVRGPLRTEWVRLRHALWNHGPDLLEAQLGQLERTGVPYVGFVACPAGEPTCAVAFAEVSLRPYVNGCKSSPVAFLEGLYVDPAWRLQGVARELVRAAEAWGRRAGCAEFASDIHLENHISHATHLALGFTETERVIYFRKGLQ